MISIICKIYSKFSQFLIFKRNRTFVTFCTWQQKCINVHCVKLVVWSLFYGFIFGLFHRSENDFLTRGLFNVDNQIVSVILNQEITTLNQTKLITLRSPWKSSVKIYPWKTYQSMKKSQPQILAKLDHKDILGVRSPLKWGPKNCEIAL